MKTKKNLMLFVGLLTILVLSACATQADLPTEVPVLVQPTEIETMEPVETTESETAEVETMEAPETVEAEETKDLSDLSDTEMEALIAEKADGNHELEFILSQEMSAEEWSATLDRMIGYGADISPEEKEAIIEWLVNR
jgi:hypothetical protein